MKQTYYNETTKITTFKRNKAREKLPLVISLMQDWSVSLACSLAGLSYQSYIYTLKEFKEFNEAHAENLERRKKART